MVDSDRQHHPLVEFGRKDWVWLGIVIGTALLLRVIYLLQLRDSPYFAYEILDSAYHDVWARKFAAGEPFDSGVFFRAPLYPWFLGVLYKITNINVMAVRLCQACLGSISCGLVYLIGRTAFGRPVAITAALAAASYWTLIFFDAELLLPNLLVFLNLLLVFALLRVATRATTVNLVLAGLALGLSAIARPNILLLAPPAAIWILYLLPRWKPALKGVVIFTLAVLIPIAPISLRNLVQGGDRVLIASQAGINFYIGNNAQADGMHVYAPGLGVNTDAIYNGSADLAEQETGRSLKPSEVSAHYMSKALGEMTANPRAALKLMLAKLGYFWTHREILNNKHLYALTNRYTPVIAFLPLGFWIVGPLGLMGLFACRGRGRDLFPLWGFVLFYMLSVVLFFVTARFRIPVVPLLMLLGAYGVQQLIAGIRGKHWRSVSVLLLALVVGGSLAARTPPGVEVSEAISLERLGAALILQERPEEAILVLEEAVTIDPGYAGARFSLARGYEELGLIPQAIIAATEALVLAEQQQESELARAISARLSHYRQGVPNHPGD
jgi:4-amino-4-deoxy-L-arabinose transferase-like glycosyltransferase